VNFNYVGYNKARQIVRGVTSAPSQEAAAETLVQSGCRVISLQPVTSFIPDWKALFPSLFRIKVETVIMFSRQMALLLESGIGIIQCLELLREQSSGRNFKRILGEVISELRRGNQLSAALGKHPESFPPIYCRSLSVGEQTGSLETVLRQMADYMEKEAIAVKDIKNALKYPGVVAVVAAIVVGVIVIFVLPSFTSLYSTLDIELPLLTRLLLSSVSWLADNGLYLMGAVLIIALAIFAYTKSPEGRYNWDNLSLKLPQLGRIRHLDELSHCCRSMALLFRAGLPLPEVMTLVIDSSKNRVVKRVLSDAQQGMLKGEGLSRPMSKSKLFLPLMVQMVKVGEETGNLDVTLTAVAQHFENEARDKMRSLIGLIQPATTLAIGVVVAFISLSLISAMYSMYGQVT